MKHSRHILQRIGHELKVNEPAIVKKVRRRKGAKAADKVKTAILLSKARRQGAVIHGR